MWAAADVLPGPLGIHLRSKVHEDLSTIADYLC